MHITFLAAFAAGLLSFLSPCVLPLVPAYLCYLAGSSFEELTHHTASARLRRRAFIASALFVAGFATIFVALGASASAAGQWLRAYQGILAQLAGIAVTLMGFHFLGLFKLRFLHAEKRFAFPSGASPLSAYAMGLAFAFGWTPCIGPVLSAILALAASEESLTRGIGLLTSYSLGLGLPFLIAGAALPLFMRFSAKARRHLLLFEKIAGAGLVVAGLLFLSGQLAVIAAWLIENFPALARLG